MTNAELHLSTWLGEENVYTPTESGGHAPLDSVFSNQICHDDQLLIAPHFDGAYYDHEYPDVELPRHLLPKHFCAVGWREGRNPNAFFDTVSYLLEHPDVASAAVNPFAHYFRHGIAERRHVVSSISPSVRTSLLFGSECTEWVNLLREFVDPEFYRSQFHRDVLSGLNLVAHFAYRGWREGKSPSADISLKALIQRFPIAARLQVNPVLALIKDIKEETRNYSEEQAAEPQSAPEIVCAGGLDAIEYIDADAAGIEAIRPEFDAEHYLGRYPDIATAGVDPLRHFWLEGWREGRNPNNKFDTSYYLRAYPDVKASGVNPFWHYVVAGRAENRRAMPAGGYRRTLIDSARARSLAEFVWNAGSDQTLSLALLKRMLAEWARDKAGLVLSLSHDCYPEIVGGVQIVIADEQRLFNGQRYGYLHLSPKKARLRLAPEEDHFEVRVVIDGTPVGTASINVLMELLAKIKTIGERLFIAHCVLGFNVDQLCVLWSRFAPDRSYYWVHDFSSVCEGYALLRNDVEFCNAPDLGSMACRICVYGDRRLEHTQQFQRLFSHCAFEVIAPAAITLAVWEKSTQLPCRTAYVLPHWRLVSGAARRPKERPVGRKHRIAFVGFPTAIKGWPVFCDLVAALVGDPRYEIFHFVADGAPTLSGVRRVAVAVQHDDRERMIAALRRHRIDLVTALSLCPETFSFAAHEALVAGANLVCLKDSGNIAAVTGTTGHGVVLVDREEVIKFFVSGAALDWRFRGIGSYRIEPSGATVSIALTHEHAGR